VLASPIPAMSCDVGDPGDSPTPVTYPTAFQSSQFGVGFRDSDDCFPPCSFVSFVVKALAVGLAICHLQLVANSLPHYVPNSDEKQMILSTDAAWEISASKRVEEALRSPANPIDADSCLQRWLVASIAIPEEKIVQLSRRPGARKSRYFAERWLPRQVARLVRT
jgi:hypothetical protein